ncbi:MAG: Rieske 2Fe-2S domain-containing protein [Agarilytica sp.]
MFLCRSSELDNNQSMRFDQSSFQFFILRRNNKVYAYRNACPHIGVTLDWAPNQFFSSDGELLQCSTHGALFIPETGACVSGPCRGQSLTQLSVEERNGEIHLYESPE